MEQSAFADIPLSELENVVLSLGEPRYRAQQLQKWFYQGLATSFEEMTDLPRSLREKLAARILLTTLTPLQEVVSSDGRTVKVLFGLRDGKTIESALMLYERSPRGKERHTVCVSTQVGCALGCPFCATGKQGLERDLTAGEIVEQVLFFARWLERRGIVNPRPVTNVVFMGMGEPLANYDAVWQAIETLASPQGFGLGARHIAVSTVGLVPQMERLSREKLQVGLAVSLHAASNRLRNRLVPLNRRYPLEKLIPACREYFQRTGRWLTFEYILFDNINDSESHATALAELLAGLNCNVNLIPANPSPDPLYRAASPERVLAFQRTLSQHHITATVRERRGIDIEGGCGQLRSRFGEEVLPGTSASTESCQ